MTSRMLIFGVSRTVKRRNVSPCLTEFARNELHESFGPSEKYVPDVHTIATIVAADVHGLYDDQFLQS